MFAFLISGISLLEATKGNAQVITAPASSSLKLSITKCGIWALQGGSGSAGFFCNSNDYSGQWVSFGIGAQYTIEGLGYIDINYKNESARAYFENKSKYYEVLRLAEQVSDKCTIELVMNRINSADSNFAISSVSYNCEWH